ncbi:MAG TPA: UDP-N-acetylglucosamine 2-epimerase (hydrolyzing) [Gammaproteobacteria bacterium]|nr:UDP-N-acetylglucosamine 2-epimerase (hydrolyzing) [Gammaproteobacteria bacterium]
MSRTRKVCIVLTTRGNYAKMKTTMLAIKEHSDLELQTILAGGIIHESFGDFEAILKTDNFHIDYKIDFLVNDGKDLESMTNSAGRATSMIGNALKKLQPDIVIVIADRYEALSISLASTCMNIPIAHLEGGEVSGSIDERIRHAITKLALVHFPANPDSALRIKKMGEDKRAIFDVGTPSIDLIRNIDITDLSYLNSSTINGLSGVNIDYKNDYLVVSQHPVVTEQESSEFQIYQTAKAVAQIGLPVFWIRPNMDAGRDGVEKALLKLGDIFENTDVCYASSLTLEAYAVLLKNSKCLIGNSSSGIRECEYMGVPVVNIGSRQQGRMRGENVIDTKYISDDIEQAIRIQIKHGPYKPGYIYGDGLSGKKIANVLASYEFELDKLITY